jgi:hypothetical protein
MNKYLFAFLLMLATGPTFAQNIGGIGAQLILDTAGGWTMPRIFSLVPGSPAYDSLRATDYIIKVNDVSCKDKTIEQVVAMIRGEAGTIIKVTSANTKQGDMPRDHQLKRASMNLGPLADPKDAFFAACDNEVKQLKQNGAKIIKTYNSDCGSYFFNFDAASGKYTIKIMALADAGNAFDITAKAFDNDHEANATELGRLDATTSVNGIPQLTGTVAFTRECVATVGLTLHNDDKKCKAMYVIVFKL